MEIKVVLLEQEKEKIKSFLKRFKLEYDKDINYSLYVTDDEKIIGTISVSGFIIKGFAVDKSYSGLASRLISEMINYLYEKGIYYYQVYTKIEYKNLFEALNFKEIVSTNNLSLLESRNRNIVSVLKNIKDEYAIESEDLACIVVNCNPFTLGHLFLITEASLRHEKLIVFVLEEDRSFFKFKDRFRLVKEGTKHLENVIVIPSTNYLVSSLTFPTYFLKEDVEIVKEEALCDALIFQKYFMPILNIKKRYLGSETDLVTNRYNQVLKEVLKDKVEIILRLQYSGENISASRVRSLLKEKKFSEIANIVPKTTLEFLINEYS